MDSGQVPEGYKQTEVGVIPEDWSIRTISETMQLINGYGFKPSEWSTEGLPIIRIQNLNDKEASFNYFNGSIEEKYHIKAGDLLFAWSGTKGTSFGARVWEGADAVLNQHIFKIIPDSKQLTDEYSYLVLHKVQEDIEKMAHGFKSSFVHVKKSDLATTALPIPAKKEQTAIAQALSDVDTLITSLEKLIAKKRAIKTATMQQLLTGKKRLPEFARHPNGEPKGYRQAELGEIPEDWKVQRIGQFTDCTAGGTPSTTISSYWGGVHPWMSSGELHYKQVFDVEERITDEGLINSSTKYVPSNSVLIGLAGQGKTRGTVAISRIELCTNQSIAAIFPSQHHISEYLYYNLENRYDELRGLSTGDGGRGGLNLSIIRNVHLPMPSITEQRAIADVISNIDSTIEALEDQLSKTQQLKQGMMQELLTGRTRLV